MNVILEGIVGSTAYGLSHEGSDVDTFGIFVAPTSDLLRLDWNDGKATVVKHEPDSAYHEVGKYIKLALQANPTVLELMFLEGYTVESKHGKMLIDNRHIFLSQRIFKSYGGYAISQVRKMNARGGSYDSALKNRFEKHTRHIYRLLQQGRQLLETGDLTVRVSNREELFEIGKLPADKIVDKFEKDFEEFDKIKSILPEQPDFERANELLLKIRKSTW